MATSSRHLKILISSKQVEFKSERAAIVRQVQPLPLLVADTAEDWSPESTPIETKSIEAAAECAIYVGLFGCMYSAPAAREYQTAVLNPHREILVYVRDCATRDPRLEQFLTGIKDPLSGHTTREFSEWSHVADQFAVDLWNAVARMVERLLRLAHPPNAMSRGPSVLQRKWLSERELLLSMGLPGDPAGARALADQLLQGRNEWRTVT